LPAFATGAQTRTEERAKNAEMYSGDVRIELERQAKWLKEQLEKIEERLSKSEKG
jgi:hypothetical protein